MKKKIFKLFYNKKTNNDFIKKSYLFGLLYYKENLKSYSKEFRFLGIPFWKKKIKTGFEKFYILGFAYFKKSSRKFLYETILKEIGNCYKNIYINFNCSGETYLFLSYLTPPPNSVFIATRKYHIDLCRMIQPEVKCIYLPDVINLRSFDDVYKEKFKGINFYNILPFNHFVELEKKLRKGLKVHYCKEICKTIGVDYTNKAKFPIISDSVKQSALQKAQKIGLNLNKFIFLCPESQSNEDPADNFWISIIEDLYNDDYDVFLNVLNLQAKYGTAKTCFLTFEEAYYIASLSKGIIGLRSGFIEYLTSLQNVPITCYYTSFKDRGLLKAIDAKTVIKGFSLKQLPNVQVENIEELIIDGE